MLIEFRDHLIGQGYSCIISQIANKSRLIVRTSISGYDIQLMLISEPPFYNLPKFILIDPESLGRLAHVTVDEYSGEVFGSICVNDPDSLSINFDRPFLVIEESLRRHIELLEKCLTDSDWNFRELIREFYSDWIRNCVQNDFKPILANIEEPILQTLDVFSPVKGQQYGIESYYMVHPSDNSFSSFSDIHLSMIKGNRNIAGRAIVIPIEQLTPAPSHFCSLEHWYMNSVTALSTEVLSELQNKYGQWRDSTYWVVFTSITVNNERTWFALKLTSKSKKALPLSKNQLVHWQLEALPIRLFNQENTVRRGGGKLSLADKKVAVIGVGSVGSEIAHKLSAAGIRHLTLVDPDLYEINNLYRHILEQHWIGAPKAFALQVTIQRQFPWSNASWQPFTLMEFAQKEILRTYDLIIIAIGNPTQERLFKQFLLDKEIEVNVINTWLEGYGIGGHAVLDVQGEKGCLLCSYVCQESGTRGLVSNMNFIEPNQTTMKNIAGCGEQFISYGAASSSQTGIMAASLAIQHLEGWQVQSCKVSWKGSDIDTKAEGIRLTHRYYKFNQSLGVLPLFDEDCDVCSH